MSGCKYVDEVKGGGVKPTGSVVAVHYTLTLLNGRDVIRTSRGLPGMPLMYALGKYDNVWIWDEVLSGMNVGGQRRVVVPPSALSHTQAACLPADDQIRMDLEMIEVSSGPFSVLAASLPPGERKAVALGMCALVVVTMAVWWANFATVACASGDILCG